VGCHCSWLGPSYFLRLEMETPTNSLEMLPILGTSISCPGIPQARMSGYAASAPIPKGQIAPDEPIRSLAITISTSSDPLSGTTDDVWLDIGPKAWKIGDDFDKGTTKTILVDLNTADNNLDIPLLVPLYVRDISQLRIEKKVCVD
jgi:hypothetical protein